MGILYELVKRSQEAEKTENGRQKRGSDRGSADGRPLPEKLDGAALRKENSRD